MRRVSQWITSPIGSVLVGLSGVATASILARELGPRGRGHFAEAMIWTNFVLTAGAFTNSQSVAYYWAKAVRSDEKKHVLGVALGGAWILALVLIPIALGVNFAALGSVRKPSFGPANLYVLTIPLSLYTFCALGVLTSERQLVAYWSVRLANALAFMLCLSVMAILGRVNVERAVLSVVLGGAAAVALSTAMLAKYGRTRPAWDVGLLRSMLGFGAKTSMTNLPYQLNVRLDQLLMSVALPAAQLGLYAAAFAWSSVLSLVGTGVSTVVLSRSVAVDPKDAGQVQRLIQQFRVVAWTICAAGVVVAAATPVSIRVLFGAEFMPAVAPGIVLCFAGIILNTNLVLHELTRGLGLPEIGMKAELAGLAGTVVLLLFLLPLFGGLGAAIASVVSYSGIMTAMVIAIRRRLDVSVGAMFMPRRADVHLLAATVRGILRARPIPVVSAARSESD